MITQNESLPLPEFEDRLWDELSQLHGNDQPDENDAGSHKPRNRSPRRRYLVAAATVALAGIGAAVVAVTTNDPNSAEDITTSPADDETASVPQDREDDKEDKPLPDARELPDAIFFQRQDNADGRVHHMWVDEATGLTRMISFDSEGNPELYDESSVTIKNPDGTVTLRQVRVDHSKGEWYEYELTRAFDPMFDSFDGREADRIRSGIAKGGYVEDGLEVIDGQELLRLLSSDPCSDTVYEEEGVTWVDPETYRPVTRRGYPGTDYGYTHTYEFLERTPENLKLLEPEIPEGFVQVDPPVLGPPPGMEGLDPDTIAGDWCDLTGLGPTTTVAASE